MLSGRGRTLLTASPRPLIDVGGVVVGQSFGRLGLGNATQAADTQLLAPPTLSFSEFLRGYQDLSTPATAYTVASATYTYPFIVDYGWASLAYLLPAFFVRQIDIDFFGEMAWLWRPGLVARRSAGGALYLRTSLGGAPLSFYAQLAARFLDGERLPPGVAPWLTVIGLSSD
jgi:hypothetical protein